ncbi:MAG: 6-bladed beta-propeller [Rhodothermaceae bacterium]|nr:6-bladed beta-propeller [Rhodothermaceae bacterium]MXX58909.1 6-bladed beta-propeller [Rhodothermaceae bacterium]MYD18444.1 6-bladed beta-propeller [Rhodothermaceae bacterium]MYD55882.1 6-bladed beta-propeller [Rhodothermaceae bacterium]MYI43707.1 6-bladed beta-propeller [Rhodothermaceae bacterium]
MIRLQMRRGVAIARSSWAAVPLLVSLLILVAGLRPEGSAEAMQTRVPELTLTEVFRIGDEDAADGLLLGRPRDMAVDSRGRLYVADSGWDELLVFSDSGVQEGVIGRAGKGPGEFERVSAVHIDAQDSVYVWDNSLQRITIFSPDEHEYVHSFKVQYDGMLPGGFVGAVDRGFLIRYFGITGWGLPARMENLEKVKLFDWSGKAIMDSVAYLPRQEMLVHDDEGVIWGKDLPFRDKPHFVLAHDQTLYYGSSSAIRLVRTAMDGAPNEVIEVSHIPVSVSKAERDKIIQEEEERAFKRILRDRLPEIKPAFVRIVPDDEERLWIALSHAEKVTAVEWLVVDSTGTVVARTELPEYVRLYAVREGRAYGRLTSPETDVPMVVAWAIDFNE